MLKHITPYKLFESTDNYEYHKEVVKDIFQDILDEYSIEEYKNTAHNETHDGLYFTINKQKNYLTSDDSSYVLYFEIWPIGGYKWDDPQTSIENAQIVKTIDFDGHKQRLELLGYIASFTWSDASGNIVSQKNSRWVRITIDYSEA